MSTTNTYLGKPCKHGHDGERYKSNSLCVVCSRSHSRAHQKRLRESTPARKPVRLEGGSTSISASVSVDLDERFKAAVDVDGRTLSACVRDALEAWLASRPKVARRLAELGRADLVAAEPRPRAPKPKAH